MVRMPIAFRRRFGLRKTSRLASGRKTASRRSFGRKKTSTVKRRVFRRKSTRRIPTRRVDKTFDKSRRSGDVGFRTMNIVPDQYQKAYVSRTYESIQAFSYANSSGVDYVGTAFSLNAIYDAATYTVPTLSCEVYQGGLAGTGTNTNIAFENVAEEFAALSQVYRFFRISKFQARVAGFPQQVQIPTIMNTNTGGAPQAIQAPTYGSMADLGTILLRSWAGGPGIASYANGTLVAQDWSDHNRYRDKKTMKASGEGGSQRQLVYSCCPSIPIAEEMPSNVTTGLLAAPLKYQKTGWIDINSFAAGHTDQAGGFGLIFYHYFPNCALATDNFIANDITFSIQIDYCGLRNTPGLTPTPQVDGKIVDGSLDHLLRSLRREEIKSEDLVRPERHLLKKLVLKEEGYEMPELKSQSQQSSIPNLKPVVKDRPLPPSRPATPTKSR